MLRIISSWDDGHPADLLIAEELKKNNIPGIFFIPNTKGKSPVLSREEIKKLNDDGFEIGGHTYSHVNDLKELSDYQLRNEINLNKKYLEEIIGKPVVSFCYPHGRYNDRVIKQLKKSGYTNARTVDVLNIKENVDKFRTQPTVHVHGRRKEYNGIHWLDISEALLKKAKEENGIFYFWGHSEEVIRLGLWDEFLDLLKMVKKYV